MWVARVENIDCDKSAELLYSWEIKICAICNSMDGHQDMGLQQAGKARGCGAWLLKRWIVKQLMIIGNEIWLPCLSCLKH